MAIPTAQRETDYYLAYFDILGYKSYFANSEPDELREFLSANIALAHQTTDITKDARDYDYKYDIKTFSDNYLLAIPVSTRNETEILQELATIVSFVQLQFLRKYGLLFRGSITKGKLYIDSRVVHGEALIRAVELENKAVFPRMIVDFAADRIPNEYIDSKYIQCDEDAQYFIKLFWIVDIGEHNLFLPYLERKIDDLVQEERNDDSTRRTVIKLISRYGKYTSNVKDPAKIYEQGNVIRKYLWLIVKFNEYQASQQRAEIPFSLTLNKRLMQAEITLLKENP